MNLYINWNATYILFETKNVVYQLGNSIQKLESNQKGQSEQWIVLKQRIDELGEDVDKKYETLVKIRI